MTEKREKGTQLVMIQIDTAELISQTATLRRPRALLPVIIKCDLFAARNTVFEPCLLATATCLLPLAAAACYICCCRLLCENQARGLLGLEAMMGRF